MGLRETLNKNPRIVTIATVVIIVLAIVVLALTMRPDPDPVLLREEFYTSDDGQTFFKDDINHVAPYDKEGKKAVLARVFKCGDKEFVGYMEMFPDDVKKQLDQIRNEMPDEFHSKRESARDQSLYVKKPGEAKWVRRYSSEGNRISTVICPDGSAATPVYAQPLVE